MEEARGQVYIESHVATLGRVAFMRSGLWVAGSAQKWWKAVGSGEAAGGNYFANYFALAKCTEFPSQGPHGPMWPVACWGRCLAWELLALPTSLGLATAVGGVGAWSHQCEAAGGKGCAREPGEFGGVGPPAARATGVESLWAWHCWGVGALEPRATGVSMQAAGGGGCALVDQEIGRHGAAGGEGWLLSAAGRAEHFMMRVGDGLGCARTLWKQRSLARQQCHRMHSVWKLLRVENTWLCRGFSVTHQYWAQVTWSRDA